MKRSLFCSYLLMIALGTAATEVSAAEPAAASTNEVSLEVLVLEALERNPELKFYQAEIAAAKAERKTAAFLANPELSGSLGQKRISSGSLSSEGAAWSVSHMQPFEWPGRIGLRKEIANHQIKLAELGYSQFKTTLAARMRTLGYRLMAAQEKAAAAREVADRFHALREVLLQRDPAGLTPALELRIIESTALT
jgi:cobalt-zinc-cadmium efflux system outer membrane protein